MKKRKTIKKLDIKMRRKLVGLFAAVLAVFFVLLTRITYINAVSGEKYKKQVLTQAQQQYDSRVLPFKRGDILDRNGTLLAASNVCQSVHLRYDIINNRWFASKPGHGQFNVNILFYSSESGEKCQYIFWRILKKTRACLKIAFRQMCVTICGRFGSNEGGVVGYVDRMRAKSPAKWGVYLAGMNFQTRSSIIQFI